MSFRYELKVRLSVSDRMELIKQLIDSGMNFLYPRRLIKSIYFDSNRLSSLHDSTEGCTPRKKLRLRTYGNSDEFFLEKKISSVEGRFKQSSLISVLEKDSYLKNGIFDQEYGHCFPVVIVSYQRYYFELDFWRLTLDENLTYSNFGSEFDFVDSENVLEFKASRNLTNTPLQILDRFGLAQSRFSKYERAALAGNLIGYMK